MHPLEALPRVECARELLRHCAPGSGMIVRSFFFTWVSLILPVLAPAWDAFCRSKTRLTPSTRGQILSADRPRGVEQPRKKLECIGKRAECIENSPHAKNTTPGFRSILAGDGPQRGGGILNFPDFVPRIRYTWYALVLSCWYFLLHNLMSEMSPFGALRSIAGAEG